MPTTTETTLEIDLDALSNNYAYLKTKLRSGVKFMGVVKAFAYGSDSVVVAKKLEQLGADYLAVAYVSEGVLLRKAGIKTPILVLHPQSANFNLLVEYCLEPSIYSPTMLELFLDFAKINALKEYPVHVKINTGMNRVGFAPNEVLANIKLLATQPTIRIKSIFSHLVASEDTSQRDFINKQITLFENSSQKLLNALHYPVLRHILNTSGILNYPTAQYDMVRSGIGLYGFENSPEKSNHLVPIARLKTIISQIHYINKGDTVGYNFGFVAPKNMKTATLPLGHADGIHRGYGNGKAIMFINGQPAKTIGNICMDMLMVDISTLDCKEGDEVIVFDQHHTAEQFTAKANTISYEIITAISARVKRIILENN